MRNAGQLNIKSADGMQVLRLMQGAYRPVNRSNLLELLNYHFIGQHAQTRPAKAPPGYTSLLNNVAHDLHMRRLMFPERTPSVSSRSSSSRTVAGRQRHPKIMGSGCGSDGDGGRCASVSSGRRPVSPAWSHYCKRRAVCIPTSESTALK